MLTLNRHAGPGATAGDELHLPFELREKSRLRATLASGEEVALFLPRGGVLRGGDCLQSTDGRVVRIVAAPEPVLEVECHDALDLARCAYHLGNRHTPLEIVGRKPDGHYVLRIRTDHVLAEMLAGLGAHSDPAMAPFEPETGAYAPAAGGHAHPHDHGHEHGHGHGHPQGPEAAQPHPTGHVPHPGNQMPVHPARIHKPDPAVWKGTQDK